MTVTEDLSEFLDEAQAFLLKVENAPGQLAEAEAFVHAFADYLEEAIDPNSLDEDQLGIIEKTSNAWSEVAEKLGQNFEYFDDRILTSDKMEVIFDRILEELHTDEDKDFEATLEADFDEDLDNDEPEPWKQTPELG